MKVTVLTAGKIDFRAIRWAGQHSYDSLLAAGVRIYQLQEPILHAKSMVIDRELCMVGSFDINKYERRNYLEAVVLVEDARLARRIEEGFRSCLPRSKEITPGEWKERSIFTRAAEWVSYRAMRV